MTAVVMKMIVEKKKSENMKTESDTGHCLSMERKEINTYLQNLTFKKRLFGVDEQDLWNKLAKLNKLYEQELIAERIRYDTLLAEYKQKVDAKICLFAEVENAAEADTTFPMWESSHDS